jgi:hypothetical protein
MTRKFLKTPESVTGTVSVWAVPETEWKDGTNQFTGKWEFRIADGAWEAGSVKIHTQEITLLIPSHVDITQMAIRTLEDKIEDERVGHIRRITALQKQLSQLRALTYNPDGHNGDEQEEIEETTHNRIRTYTDPADGARVIDLGVASPDEDDIPF